MIDIIGFVITSITAVIVSTRWYLKYNYDYIQMCDELRSLLPPENKLGKEIDTFPFKTIDVTKAKIANINIIDMMIKRFEIFEYNKIRFGKKEIKDSSDNIHKKLSNIENDFENKFNVAILDKCIFSQMKRVYPKTILKNKWLNFLRKYYNYPPRKFPPVGSI